MQHEVYPLIAPLRTGPFGSADLKSNAVIRIDDIQDPRLEVYVDLRHQSVKPGTAHFIAEGRLVVGRLIDSDYQLHSLLVERGSEAEFASRLPANVPIYSVLSEQIHRLVGFDFHRGVIACGYRKTIASLSDYQPRSGNTTTHRDRRSGAIALAALGVTEAANLGGMIRTAAAFGIHQVLLGPGTYDPLARRVIRTSMASTFKMTYYRIDDPVNQLPLLTERFGCRTIATTLASDATPIDALTTNDSLFRRGQNAVLLMGNEAHGLDPATQRVATDRVTIPMALGVDSLNVATAAAIFMYELTRPNRTVAELAESSEDPDRP